MITLDQELRRAVSAGDQADVFEALKLGANAKIILPEYSGYRNVTLLHVAALEDHAYLIDPLARAGAPWKHFSECGMTAMHLAARYGHMEVIKELIDKGASYTTQSSRGYNTMHIATVYGHANVIIGLVAMKRWVVDKTTNSLNNLHLAAMHDQAHLCKLFVDESLGVREKTDRGFNAVHIAAGSGNSSVIRELVTNCGANLNWTTDNGFNALHIAAQKGQPEVMDELIKLGMNINSATSRGQKANHIAASNGHPHVLRKLKDLGMDLNTPASSGWTAVHFAVKFGHLRCVETLAKLDVSLDIPDNKGITPMEMAMKEQKFECMEALKAGGAKFSTIDMQDEVYQAIKDENLATLRFLIENGMDPNAPDRIHGKTPLQWAERRGDKYIINWLTKKIQETSSNLGIHASRNSVEPMDTESSIQPVAAPSGVIVNRVPGDITGTLDTQVIPGSLVHTGEGNIENKTTVVHVAEGATLNITIAGNNS